MLRSAAALAAGILRETGEVALPEFVRRSRLYQNLVDSTLRFLIEQVGQVEGAYPGEEKLAEDFLLRRTAGNGLELIGILTFRASPVWVMAAVADVSGAGRQLVREIAAELQREGLLEPGASFDTVEQMLDSLERTSARIAQTCNTPPLDVASLRSEWAALRQEIASIPASAAPSLESLWSVWRELQAEARAQGRSVFELSTLLALSAVAHVPQHLVWLGRSTALAARKTGSFFASALLDHYREALGEIHRTGWLRYWAREFRPYLRAAARQFSPRRKSLTERLMRGGAVLFLCALSLPAARVSPADLRAHVEFLSSDLLEGRATPSAGLDLAAAYIAAQFRRAGLAPLPDGSYFQTAGPGLRNVAGVRKGSGAGYLLVTAHYDHVGARGSGDGDRIFNGANDNASGVATLLEIAAQVAAAKPPRRTVVFIAFYGEERGMLGSRYYAANPIFPIGSTVAQINIEQTGRSDDVEGTNARTFNVTGFDYSEVAAILQAAAAPHGVRVLKRDKWSDAAFDRSDNEALAKLGIPAHTLSASYMFPDYHRETDEWPKLDYENMAAITEAAAAGVLALANRVTPPRWYSDTPNAAPFALQSRRVTTRPAAPRGVSAPKSGNSPAIRKPRQSKPSPPRSQPAPAGPPGTAPRQKSASTPPR